MMIDANFFAHYDNLGAESQQLSGAKHNLDHAVAARDQCRRALGPRGAQRGKTHGTPGRQRRNAGRTLRSPPRRGGPDFGRGSYTPAHLLVAQGREWKAGTRPQS